MVEKEEAAGQQGVEVVQQQLPVVSVELWQQLEDLMELFRLLGKVVGSCPLHYHSTSLVLSEKPWVVGYSLEKVLLFVQDLIAPHLVKLLVAEELAVLSRYCAVHLVEVSPAEGEVARLVLVVWVESPLYQMAQ